MVMIAIAVIVAAAAAIVAVPYFRPAPNGDGETADPSVEDWTLKLEVARAALKDLEFDHSMGRLSESDLLSLRFKCEARASVVLQELDNLRVTARMKGARTRIEQGPAAGDGSRLEGSALVEQREVIWTGAVCGQCGAPHIESDSSCHQCGTALCGTICPICATRAAVGDRYCAKCGSQVNRTLAVAG